MSISSIIIREAVVSDVPSIFQLIQELALFEKAPEQVINSEMQLMKDGFGENPLFHCLVAEMDDVVRGMSLFYYRYSTWKGKSLYLEDLIVTETHRNLGLGKQLFEATIDWAKMHHCVRMNWQVLDWNEPAILFYKNYGSSFDSGWLNAFIDLK